MRYLLLILSSLFCYPSYSQVIIKDDSLFQKPAQEIKYPPGYIPCNMSSDAYPIDGQKWKTYLNENLVLDDASLDTVPAGTYKAVVQFVISKDGTITDIKVSTDPGYGLGTRVKNVISSCKEQWTPASQNGRTCRSYHKLPITFIVEEEKEDCEKPLSVELIL